VKNAILVSLDPRALLFASCIQLYLRKGTAVAGAEIYGVECIVLCCRKS
jgi:hypothetical protein